MSIEWNSPNDATLPQYCHVLQNKFKKTMKLSERIL